MNLVPWERRHPCVPFYLASLKQAGMPALPRIEQLFQLLTSGVLVYNAPTQEPTEGLS